MESVLCNVLVAAGHVWYDMWSGQLCVMAHISGRLEPLVRCFPAAVGVRLCACVRACMCRSLCMRRSSSCCSGGFDAEPLLTCRHTAGQGGRVHSGTPFMGTWVKNGLRKAFYYRCGLFACMLELSCSCKFNNVHFVFYCGRKERN